MSKYDCYLPGYLHVELNLVNLLIMNASKLTLSKDIHTYVNNNDLDWIDYTGEMEKGYVGHYSDHRFLCVYTSPGSDQEVLMIMYLFRCSHKKQKDNISYQWLYQPSPKSDFINNSFRPVSPCWNDEGVIAFIPLENT